MLTIWCLHVSGIQEIFWRTIKEKERKKEEEREHHRIGIPFQFTNTQFGLVVKLSRQNEQNLNLPISSSQNRLRLGKY